MPVKYRVRHEADGWAVTDANSGTEFVRGLESSQDAWNYIAGLIASCPIRKGGTAS